MLDPNMEYFPDADDPVVAPFAMAFVKLMFAHARLDERIRDLLGVITGDPDFGEKPGNLWAAKARGREDRVRKLMEEAKIEATPAAHQILQLLDQAIRPCDRRNLLAHGVWWCFNPSKQTISVRGGTSWPNQDQQVELSASEIDAVAEDFLNIEAQLYTLKAQIVTAIITVSPERANDLRPCADEDA
jgi:hypothetical protein